MTAMLNWYRASEIVVPQVGESGSAPAWTSAPFPKIVVPTLVLWAMRDTALLPIQLGGLYDLVEDLRMVTIPDAGHFVPWEQPRTVASAIRDFMHDARSA
jgi:pimeloyl-ACP methyl ester carboxylesterase